MRDPQKLIRIGVATAVLGGFGLAVKAVVLPELPRAEAAPAPGFATNFPTYGNAQVFPMGDDVVSNGMPMRLGYYLTRASPREVAQFYDTLWRKQGLTVQSVGTSKQTQVTAYDTTTHEMRNATVKLRGEQSYVFCSVSDMANGKADEGQDDVIPLPEEAAMAQRTTVREAGHLSRTVTFTAERTVAAEMERLDQAFTQAGWQLAAEGSRKSAKGMINQYRKGARTSQVAVAGTQEQGLVAVQVSATDLDEGSAQ